MNNEIKYVPLLFLAQISVLNVVFIKPLLPMHEYRQGKIDYSYLSTKGFTATAVLSEIGISCLTSGGKGLT